MVKLKDKQLAYIIQEKLIKKNLRYSFQYEDLEFSESELESIKQLNIESVSDISDLIYLKNLEALQIYNKHINDPDKFNEIQDFSVINKLSSLKKLYIQNDYNIKKLNVSNLNNLEELGLIYNLNLTEIKGLRNHKNLKKLILISNGWKLLNEYKEEADLFDNINKVLLDINHYHQLFFKTNKVIKKNILFAEKIGFLEVYLYTPKQIRIMHKKYMDIIETLNIKDKNDRNKVKEIYKYVISNLTYDYNMLEKRDQQQFDGASIFSNNEKLKRYKQLNTSYGALYNRKVVCEGYVNMMRLMLTLVEIESRTTYSYIIEHGLEIFNHSAMSVNLEKWYYSDPELYKDRIDKILIEDKEFNDTHVISHIDKKMLRKK